MHPFTSPSRVQLVHGVVLALTFCVGLLSGPQVAANKACSMHFGYGLAGTVVSFWGGFILLCIMVVVETWQYYRLHLSQLKVSPELSSNANCSAPIRRVPLQWKERPHPALLLPGTLGVLFVTLSIVISGIVGYALWWIPVVVFQLAGSAMLDHLGLARPTPIPMTAMKALALATALVGAVLAVVERATVDVPSVGSAGAAQFGLCILGAAMAGLLMPFQAALNRKAATLLPSRLQATWWSFAVGTATACVALGIHAAAESPSFASSSTSVLPTNCTTMAAPLCSFNSSASASMAASPSFAELLTSSTWIMYVGGPLGVAYIGSTIYFTGIIGSAPFFVSLVCGQLASAAILDGVGFLGTPVREITALRGVGIALVMLASAAFAYV